jgi:hypothetical protein
LNWNCFLKPVIKKKKNKEGRGRRGRRLKRLLDVLEETRAYWKLKEEALDCPVWRICFGRGYVTFVEQTAS